MSTDVPKDRYFESGGLRLHYMEWGDVNSTPLVLLHHVGSQAHVWDDFAGRMAPDYHVLALDLRGHGDSGWADAQRYTTEDYASDVAALAARLQLSKTIILGGSLGGRVALVYAAQNPEIVDALIMEDVGAVRPNEIAQRLTDMVSAGEVEFDTVEEWADHVRGGNTRTPYEAFLHNARHATKRLPNGKLGLKRDPGISQGFGPLELWDYVERVRSPFLLVVGSESAIVTTDQREGLLRIIPDSELVEIEGAGHIIVQDRPEEFEQTVRGFLTSHGL